APQQIPAGRQYRGHGYLKGHGPRLIRTWTLDDTAVQALPVSVWHADTTPPAPDRGGRHLHLVKPTPPASAEADPPAPAGGVAHTDAETAVLAAVRTAAGPVRQKQLVDVCGLTKGTVSKTVTKLLAA
ncbi:MarR family transcriptional regulator, partial [Candidatus Frankia alpina]|uniref:MarR family transcriptional regulator n=1 Tax=Candidatus Frankia alpina TaxID=2699483 RepID=UPI0013D57BCD